MYIRGVPEIHEALRQAAKDNIFVPGPTTMDDGPTYWVPCARCSTVLTVRALVARYRAVCSDCVKPSDDEAAYESA